MVKKARSIVWDKDPLNYLKAAIRFIRKDSPQNAELVQTKFKVAINELIDNPTKHALDKYRIYNDGSYRAFEIYRFRITYYMSKEEIRIVRIRHTSQEPIDY